MRLQKLDFILRRYEYDASFKINLRATFKIPRIPRMGQPSDEGFWILWLKKHNIQVSDYLMLINFLRYANTLGY